VRFLDPTNEQQRKAYDKKLCPDCDSKLNVHDHCGKCKKTFRVLLTNMAWNPSTKIYMEHRSGVTTNGEPVHLCVHRTEHPVYA
jgi:hypothetical protein